jgi:hypothetical protein
MPSNHSFDEFTNSVPSAATLYADLLLTGKNSTFTGSDHYPIVGDYNIVVSGVAAPVLTGPGFGTNGDFEFTLTSTANTVFAIEASTDLLNWTDIGSSQTDAGGLMLFQDTNAAGFPNRYYRARWPGP